MVVHLKSIVFACLSLLLFTGCQKENEETGSTTPPVLTDEQMILGEWEWQLSVPGGFADPTDTLFADSADYKKTLLFDGDSVTRVTHYTSLDTTTIRKHPYEFIVVVEGADSIRRLQMRNPNPETNAKHYHLTPDTLTLDDKYRDGSFQLYLKVHNP